MTLAFHLTVLASVLALLVFIWTLMRVGRARVKYSVPSPAMDGPVEFQRAYRAQMNTLEQLVLFLPSLWLAYAVSHAVWPALIGFVWPLGRILYVLTYAKDPKKRAPGFMLTFWPSFILLLLALGTAAVNLV